MLIVGIFSGIFALSFAPRHLKFWIESYLNKPNAKLKFQFKEVNLSLSQWGVLPIIGLKSSLVKIDVQDFKGPCFAVNTLNLNNVFIKISPFDLLFGRVHFSSLKVGNVELGFNSFCGNVLASKLSEDLSYFMKHKAQREIHNFVKWLDEIEVDNFFVSNQINKIILIKNLKLVSYQEPKFLSLSGDIFPYIQGSFKTVKAIKPKILIYPHVIKSNWWWHLHEGVVELNTQLYFSSENKTLPKYQSQLKIKGEVSYFPISSALSLLKEMKITNVNFPELSTWLSCKFNGEMNFLKTTATFGKKGVMLKGCQLEGADFSANLDNSSWGINPVHVKKNTNLYFFNVSVEKFFNPFFAKWIKESNYFSSLNPTFRKGTLVGRLAVLKNTNWNISANLKEPVFNFFQKNKIKWFAAPDLDISVKASSGFSKISLLLNNISLPGEASKKTQVFLRYDKAVGLGSSNYVLSELRFNKNELSQLKGFPFLNYLEEKVKNLK